MLRQCWLLVHPLCDPLGPARCRRWRRRCTQANPKGAASSSTRASSPSFEPSRWEGAAKDAYPIAHTCACQVHVPAHGVHPHDIVPTQGGAQLCGGADGTSRHAFPHATSLHFFLPPPLARHSRRQRQRAWPVQDAWPQIREEYLSLRRDHRRRFVEWHDSMEHHARPEPGWSVFGLRAFGHELAANSALAPVTSKLLGAVPGSSWARGVAVL